MRTLCKTDTHQKSSAKITVADGETPRLHTDREGASATSHRLTYADAVVFAQTLQRWIEQQDHQVCLDCGGVGFKTDPATGETTKCVACAGTGITMVGEGQK